ncbi:MAG: hypothetical protein IKX18_07865 [Muribaculaceae bacterium]|nr:hypothetical protein [Muribaculaceae bacterium]
MKKLSFLLLSLLAVTLLTACGSEDDPVNKQTVSSTINARMINVADGSVVFSQNTGKIEVNFTDKTIQFTCSYKDLNGQTQNLTTPVMNLVLQKGSVYYIETGSQAIARVGRIDLSSGMMLYRVSDPEAGTQLVITTHLLYAYATTTMTNPENGNNGSHELSAYLFALDSKGETCIMSISNFVSNMSGAVDASEVVYEGLTVTPNGTGYKVTAPSVSYNGFYTLTDVDFTLSEQCEVINGSFKCNGINYSVTGTLFPAD